MPSQAQIRNSPYLVAFMLAAMMVWSFSAITRSMDGALQRTHVELRAPIADLGTAIQESAIAMKHRLKPHTPPAAAPTEPTASISRQRPAAPTMPVVQDAFGPVTVPEVAALTQLIASSTSSKGKGKGSSSKSKKAQTFGSPGMTAAHVLGPPTPDTDPHPGQGKATKRASR